MNLNFLQVVCKQLNIWIIIIVVSSVSKDIIYLMENATN